MCGCNNLFECCHVVKGDFYWLCLISSYCHSSAPQTDNRNCFFPQFGSTKRVISSKCALFFSSYCSPVIKQIPEKLFFKVSHQKSCWWRRDVTYFLPNLWPCGTPKNKYQIHILMVKYRVLWVVCAFLHAAVPFTRTTRVKSRSGACIPGYRELSHGPEAGFLPARRDLLKNKSAKNTF